MPTLEWIGKEKVINHHQDVPFRLLEKKYTYNAESSENMIIHGDNLLALKSLLPQYEGRVDCIYIDPPYNTGNEKWVYNDNVNDPRIKKWLGEVVGAEGEDLSRHDKWLCMMYPRLKLLYKLLSDHGAIFISIDDNEQANLKLLCDEIFGSTNAIGPIIQNKMNAKNDTLNVQKNHEFILAYRKKPLLSDGGKIIPTLVKQTQIVKEVFEENGEFYYINDAITTRGEGGTLIARPNLGYTVYYNPLTKDKVAIIDYNIEKVKDAHTIEDLYTDNVELVNQGYIPIRPPKVRGKLGCWTWSIDKFNEDKRFIVITGKSNNYAVKKRTFVDKNNVYKDENKFYYRTTTLSNSRSILEFSTNDGTSIFNEIMGQYSLFDNPKNVSLLEYLFNLIPYKTAVILDSFAGSGTTAHAVLDLNKKDGGNRKFILVEMMDYADTITAERVKRVIDGYSTDGAAARGGGANNSFSYYELGAPLFDENKNLNEAVPLKEIRTYIFYMETKQPPEVNPDDNEYFLGKHNDTAYYFYYEKERATTLNTDFLSTIKTKASGYLIYADVCTLSKTTMEKYNITFKKIPRDIQRL